MVSQNESSPEESVRDALSGADDQPRQDAEGTPGDGGGWATVDQEPEPEKASEPAIPELRTYRQEEFASMESAKDKEINALKQRIREGEQLANLAKQADEERRVREVDQTALGRGDITESEVEQRESFRQRETAFQQEMGERREVYARIDAEANRVGRIVLAEDLAVIHQINASALINDETLLTEPAMRAKARDLQQDKRDKDYEDRIAIEKGRESFDANSVRTGGSTPFDRMSPEEKITSSL